jgi:hypothetical protein
MQPEARKEFISAYRREINPGRDEAAAQRTSLQRQLGTVHSKLDGLYDAVAEGLRTPGLLARIEALEADKAKIAGLPNPPRHRCVCNLISQMSIAAR